MFNGVHAAAKNEWLTALEANWSRIIHTPLMTDRLRILEDIATNIKGIGPNTIDETNAWLILYLSCHPQEVEEEW